MTRWYRKLDNHVTGPFTLEELTYLRDRGKLTPQDQLRGGADGPWVAADSVNQLFAASTVAATAGTAAARTPAETQKEEAFAETADPFLSDSPVVRPPVPASRQPDGQQQLDTKQKVAIGSAIGVTTILLILLLLLLFKGLMDEGDGGVADGGGGSAGQGTGDGGGVGSGTGSGAADSSDGGGDAAANADSDGTGSGSAETEERGSSDSPEEASPVKKLVLTSEPDGISVSPVAAPTPRPAPSGSGGRTGSGGGGGGTGRGSGGGSEFDRRLRREGGKSGDVQISLLWNNYNDIDLYVKCPSGETISYQNQNSRCGGELDVDMNAGGVRSAEPVENVVWSEASNGAPPGEYKVFVHHFQNNGGRDPTVFEVRVIIGGRTKTFRESVIYGEPHKHIYTFTKR